MTRSQYYGKLGTATLPSEVREIWYSRNDKMKRFPRLTIAPLAKLSEFEVLVAKDYAHKLIEITPLSQREELVIAMHICAGYTLQEVAQTVGVTQERIRQIAIKALRKFRRAVAKLGEGYHDD